MNDTGKFTPSEKKFVASFLLYPTMGKVADSCGLGVATCWRYLRKEHVRQAIDAELSNHIKASAAALASMRERAIETLTEILNDKSAPAGARVSAAKFVLSGDRTVSVSVGVESDKHRICAPEVKGVGWQDRGLPPYEAQILRGELEQLQKRIAELEK